MVNLGRVDLQLGLSLHINVNDVQIKFEVHKSKNVAKMAQNRPESHFCPNFVWTYNSANFYPI